MKQQDHRFRPLITIIILCTILPSSGAWTRMDLAGIEVTSIIGGNIQGSNSLVAGTAKNGVYASHQGGAFNNIGTPAKTGVEKGLVNIRSLCLLNDGMRLFAGTDSGLFAYTFTSGVLPTWKKVDSIAGLPVTAITAIGDTVFCCTPWEIYRSLNGGTTWAGCKARSFLPRLGDITSFTSLVTWHGTINAGSRFLGAMSSWEGVMQSRDGGKTWADISLLAGQGQSLTPTLALLSYAPRFDSPLRLLAATETGLYFVVDTDTGIWRPLENQLPMVPRILNWTNFSRSNVAELFAATDSGVYILTPKVNTVGWFKALDVKAFAVTSYVVTDPAEWFAGTVDGVWRLTNTAVVGNVRIGATPDRPAINTVHHRRIDIQGRVIRGAERGNGYSVTGSNPSIPER